MGIGTHRDRRASKQILAAAGANSTQLSQPIERQGRYYSGLTCSIATVSCRNFLL
jgi:hypothetical protein